MAETIGIVQQANITQGSGQTVCFFVGPSSSNSEVLTVNIDNNSLIPTSFIAMLVAAQASQREVRVQHGDQDGVITGVSFSDKFIGDMTVVGNMAVSGNMNVSGEFIGAGNMAVSGNMNVSGEFIGDMTVAGNVIPTDVILK